MDIPEKSCLRCNNAIIKQSPQNFKCDKCDIDVDTIAEMYRRSARCKKFDAVLK